MISNQILQDTIEGIKSITRIDLCVMDTEGKSLASTFTSADEYEDAVLAFVNSPAESQVLQGYQFFKVSDDNQLEYIILAKGETDDVYMIGKIAAFQVQNLLVAYKERFDKDNFIKNLLLDNLLLVDIYNRAKKLHIDTDVRRVVFIIETKNEKDNNALETVRSIFSTKTKDFITAVDEKNIILVKEVKQNETYEDMAKTASVIVDMLNTEVMTQVHVAYGIIQQCDTPQNLYDSPQNLFVAGFMGSPAMNFVEAKVVKSGADVLLMFGSHSIKVPEQKAAKLIEGNYIEREVILGIRPEDIHDEQLFIESSPESVIDADIKIYEMLGAEVYLYFAIDQYDITARVNSRTTARPGDIVQLALDLSKIHIFDKETEKVITN